MTPRNGERRMRYPSLFSFCPHCSAGLIEFTSDDVTRRKCPQCGWIQYRNPTVGVAVVLIERRQLLIGDRRDGGWCIPCGHVEWDETIEEAAVREMAEETGLTVRLEEIVAVKSNFHDRELQTVGIWFRGRRESGTLRPGGDLVDLAFAEFENLPPLKFPTDLEVAKSLHQS